MAQGYGPGRPKGRLYKPFARRDVHWGWLESWSPWVCERRQVARGVPGDPPPAELADRRTDVALEALTS
jgi:hypothetical protein